MSVDINKLGCPLHPGKELLLVSIEASKTEDSQVLMYGGNACRCRMGTILTNQEIISQGVLAVKPETKEDDT